MIESPYMVTVAAMFVFIIASRSLLGWAYARWAKRRGLFSVRRSQSSRTCQASRRFTWMAFTRYWRVLPGIGNTVLQYAYYVTEGLGFSDSPERK